MEKSSNISSTCGGCGVCRKNMLRCFRCNQKSYCSKECQKKDWREYKLSCKPPEVANSYMKDRMGDTLWCEGGKSAEAKKAQMEKDEEVEELAKLNKLYKSMRVSKIKDRGHGIS